MFRKRRQIGAGLLLVALSFTLTFSPGGTAVADPDGPVMLHPRLDVRPVTTGLVTPITLAFIGPNDFLLLEKNTGQVKRVVNGAVQGTVLDLGVNFASERGLLGIALHPNFPTNPGVYLYWTCQAPPPPPETRFFPTQETCPDQPALGADTNNVLAV